MKLKILQWNIWFKERAENIIKLIKEIDPDILCLQELTVGFDNNNNQDVAKLISKKTNLNYNFALAHKFEDNHVQGNGIFSRFPIIENSNFFVLDVKDSTGYSSEGRVCAVSKIQIEKTKTILLATAHLSYNHKFTETKEKIREVKTLLKYLKKYREKVIFTGDLNISPNTKSIKLIEKQLVHCGPNYKEPTWTTKPFSYNGFEETKLRWRLDYAFATKDIKVISSKIIKTKYSDHLPVLIEVEV